MSKKLKFVTKIVMVMTKNGRNQWSVVSGQWSVGSGQWAVVSSQESGVRSQGVGSQTGVGSRGGGLTVNCEL